MVLLESEDAVEDVQRGGQAHIQWRVLKSLVHQYGSIKALSHYFKALSKIFK